jgi:flagellar basal-body rod modification protein FlgD
MNALLGIRNNALGNLSPTVAKRREVAEEVQGMFRAKMLGYLRQKGLVSKSATSLEAASSTVSTKATGTETQSREVNKELGKEAFLQLLVTQMQHQDPLEPMDNSQMIAQLAQFTSLEQMNNLNDNFTALSGNIDQLNFISANSLLGREVTGVDIEGQAVSGQVERVQLNGSLVYLTVGDQIMSMAGVMGIQSP